ncbi:CDK5 and ABL1 enzyme substrate 2-like [Gossypium australe]|uniref:CDK5 and ABL1 enzyme substrate 2-like n=1 Tax=Gossypium australe TaxID=47621 RepID=A0A5B6VEQ5_9ROSI|nr:CDK5 and ABL1 enzyme substrate 2-like [Gossypium australe]
MKKTASSFCMCFVPVVSDNGLMVGKGSKKSSSLSEVKPLHSPAANVVDSGVKDKDGVGSFGRKNKSGRQSLSRYVKAVFFGTSLMKKMRSKKYKFKSKSKFKSEWLNSMHNNNVTIEDVDHSTRSMSSKFSSCLSKSTSLPYDPKPLMSKTVGNNGVQGKLGKGNGKGRHCFNVGVCCLLLVSLLVLVIWGKVCAIFCTSAVLVFANRLITSIKQGPSENIAVDHCMPEIGSEQYKKKIIMEGLLERNHIRNLY